MIMSFEIAGPAVAVTGSALSIVGTLYNNLKLDHRKAMLFWMVSNPVLLIWAVGNVYGFWDGGLSAGALGVMYLVFTITNFYGLYFGGKQE